MKVFKYYSELKKWQKKKLVCTIGNFDGVHRAHQRIISDVKRIAEERDAHSLIITFKNHPLQSGKKKQKPI